VCVFHIAYGVSVTVTEYAIVIGGFKSWNCLNPNDDLRRYPDHPISRFPDKNLWRFPDKTGFIEGVVVLSGDPIKKYNGVPLHQSWAANGDVL
jgi:hypothetical protein